MNFVIGSVVFDRPLVWPNREDWPELGQSRERTVGGGQVVFTGPLAGGRPIVIEARRRRCWVTQSQVDALKAMARQAGATFTFEFGLEAFDIEFDHSDGPAVRMTAAVPRTEPAGTDIYFGTIHMRTV